MKDKAMWHQALLSITNKNNDVLTMTSLIQWQTYENLFEGQPDSGLNEVIAQNFFNATNVFYGLDENQERGAYYIEADTTPIEGGAMGDEEFLPVVTCAANFRSEKPVMDKDYSRLVILWHQSQPALPVDEEILQVIRSLDWGEYAEDLDY